MEPRPREGPVSARSRRYKKISSYSREADGSPSGSVWSTMSEMAKRDTIHMRSSDQRQHKDSVPSSPQQVAGTLNPDVRGSGRKDDKIGAAELSQARHVHAHSETGTLKQKDASGPNTTPSSVKRGDGDIRRYMVRRSEGMATPAPKSVKRSAMISPIIVDDSEGSESSASASLSSTAASKTGTRKELRGPEETASSDHGPSGSETPASAESQNAAMIRKLADENRELKVKMARMEALLQQSLELGQRAVQQQRPTSFGPPAQPPQRPQSVSGRKPTRKPHANTSGDEFSGTASDMFFFSSTGSPGRYKLAAPAVPADICFFLAVPAVPADVS